MRPLLHSPNQRPVAAIVLLFGLGGCGLWDKDRRAEGDSNQGLPPCGDDASYFYPTTYEDNWSSPPTCDYDELCVDSFIWERFQVSIPHPESGSVWSIVSEVRYVREEGEQVAASPFRQAEVTSELLAPFSNALWRPDHTLLPRTDYDVWVYTDQGPCWSHLVRTSAHGGLLDANLPTPVYVADVSKPATPLVLTGAITLGPTLGLHVIGLDTDNSLFTVRLARMSSAEAQNFCGATIDYTTQIDDVGAFQITGMTWLGPARWEPLEIPEGRPEDGFVRMLTEPYILDGQLAPDGSSMMLMITDAMVDTRLADERYCEKAQNFIAQTCADGATCCGDLTSTAFQAFASTTLTSLEHVAQDNCHARCPTSADNPDCTLP